MLPLALACAFFAGGLSAAEALASPPDEWSLEHGDDDSVLVQQRMAKLRKNPFDVAQWRALSRAMGKQRLARRLIAAHEANPNDVASAILAARAHRALDDPSTAARVLSEIEPRSGRWTDRVFELRIDALEAAGDFEAASQALERRSDAETDPSRRRARLVAAHRLAERGNYDARALALARKLAAEGATDPEDQLRVARSATAAEAHDEADLAYAEAWRTAKTRDRDDIATQRARARLAAGRPSDAATQLWKLLEVPRHGSARTRVEWWELLEDAHRRAATSEQLVDLLGPWLSEHDAEVAAWRAYARATAASGGDAVAAWRKATLVAPKDLESRLGLVIALEAEGRNDEALAEYGKLRGKTREEVQLGLDMATRLLTNGERDAAMKVAASISEGAGRDPDTLLLLLEFYNDVEESEQALAVARRLASARSRDAEARIALGEQLYQMGRTEEALEVWGALPNLIRPSHAGWARHAQVLSEHSDMGRNRRMREAALLSLEKALKGRPEHAEYLRLRATLHEDGRDLELALEDWHTVRMTATTPRDRLIRDEARTREVELLVGSTLHDRGRQRNKAEADAREQLGAGSRPRATRREREEAVEAGRFLAELYVREQAFPAAIDVYNDLDALTPDDAEILMDLANAQRRAGQLAAARATLERVLALDPSRRPDALSELSEIAYKDGDEGAALDAARLAAKGGTDGGRALLRLGELHERDGDLARARAAYEAALRSGGGAEAPARMKLAELDVTEGRLDEAAAGYAALLESTGNSDLIREAGLRALDLAEQRGELTDVLELAIIRTKRQPDAAEPRELLLDVLDRVEPEALESWLRRGGQERDEGRARALRAPLVAALGRANVGMRRRAAHHLGALALPETAVPLARVGAQLTAPHDATGAVRDAYERARTEAIVAAGRLQDPDAVPILGEILRKRGGEARYAAAWALANARSPEAASHLRPLVRPGSGDQRLLVTACLGLALADDPGSRLEDVARVSRLARSKADPIVRHACTFAEGVLTGDQRAHRLLVHLASDDPMVAGLAAWRLGRVEGGPHVTEIRAALWVRVLGPPGLSRDAAARALSKHARAPLPELPYPEQSRDWATAMSRWMADRMIDGNPAEIELDDVDRKALRAALEEVRVGTRAQRRAASQRLGPCEGAHDPTSAIPDPDSAAELCLEPLVNGSVKLPAAR